MNVIEWLDSPPAPEDIKVKDGAKYIPYKIIIDKLYQLCGHDWSDYNFHETYITLPNRKVLVSGNIEVEVNYTLTNVTNIPIKRRLSGGANFILNKGSNPHPTGTVKSLAIMNAVKPLGVQFGWGLNPENEEEKTEFLPILKTEKPEPGAENKRMVLLINQCSTIEELTTYRLLAKQHKATKEFNSKMKTFKK